MQAARASEVENFRVPWSSASDHDHSLQSGRWAAVLQGEVGWETPFGRCSMGLYNIPWHP